MIRSKAELETQAGGSIGGILRTLLKVGAIHP